MSHSRQPSTPRRTSRRQSFNTPGRQSALRSPSPSLSPSPGPNSSSNRGIQRSGTGIKVVARFRPENETELRHNNNNEKLIDFQSETSLVVANELQFTFDHVFQPHTSQAEVFDYSVKDTVSDLFKGYNGTILAYGQTGSGKTYTMMGATGPASSEHRGLIPRIADSIFATIVASSSETEFTVAVSYMEIYMEQLRDLLSPGKARLMIQEDRENGIHVKGLKTVYVTTAEEMYELMAQGSEMRATASTNMNEDSSRSHAIFQITVVQKFVATGLITRGSLFLVDLAGSEKVDKTGAMGQTLEEAKKINTSLSSLGNVINALTDPKSSYVPYRDSKLTRILQESLGGNSRTSLIITCSPASWNLSETVSTLRFGARAKKIKNKARINTELSSSELKKSLAKANAENARLLSLLQLHRDSDSDEPKLVVNQQQNELEDQLRAEKEKNARLLEKLRNTECLLFETQKQNKDLKKLAMRSSLTKADKQRIVALEKTLDQFTAKLNDMTLQNSLIKRDVTNTKKLVESRHERLRDLKNMVKTQQNAVESQSVSFEYKLAELSKRFASLKRQNDEKSVVSPTSEDFSSFGSPLEPNFPIPLEEHEPVPMENEISGVGLKKGVNFRIVKPVRGGVLPPNE